MGEIIFIIMWKKKVNNYVFWFFFNIILNLIKLKTLCLRF
jgi:hypothetical protein